MDRNGSILRRQLLCPPGEGSPKVMVVEVDFSNRAISRALFGRHVLLDRLVPQLMTKAIVFMPVVGVGFAVESITMQPLIDRFKPSEAR